MREGLCVREGRAVCVCVNEVKCFLLISSSHRKNQWTWPFSCYMTALIVDTACMWNE